MEVIKIKNILTAVRNPKINYELKKYKLFNIINNDIQYQDGILECLENNKQIDYLILSQSLPGNYKLEELIEKIQENNSNIKIIILLEKYDQELEKILNKKGIYRVLYLNKINIDNLIKIINEDEKMEKYKSEIQKEIDELKNIIYEEKYKKNENKKANNKKIKEKKIIKFNYLKNNYVKKENKKIIISVLGNNGSGKSIFSSILAKELENYYNKILIIDFDILNKSIHTIFGVKKYSKILNNYLINKTENNNFNIYDLIIKINKKIDLLSEINLIFNNKNKLNYEKLKKLINLLLNNYDAIIIDTTSEYFFEHIKEIIEVSDKCLFLTENNLLEISKSKRILEKYLKLNIEKNKIKIIFNKCNKIKINYLILKNIFSEFEIIGYLNYFKNYNLFINKNLKCNFLINNNFKKIVKKIIDKKRKDEDYAIIR